MIDAHVHLITAGMVEDSRNRFLSHYPEYAAAIGENSKKLFNDDFLHQIKSKSLEEMAGDWLKEMDANGLERAVFFPISERPEEVRDFVKIAPERFCGYAYLNDPTAPDAPEKLRRAVTDYGLKGLKLYPSLQLFHACDKAIFPLYEEAVALGIPITFHFGITHAPVADYRYINPLDLQLPLKLFPKLNFIVAHFGAGFFREVCMIAFHNQNLFLDSSGTNNWRTYQAETLELTEIFKKAVELVTPERILFGTDTVLLREGTYRAAIKSEQEEIVGSIGLTTEEQEKILGENARRLYL